MEQQYYNDHQKDGLTFRDVGMYLKKAAPFTIVCLIVCCIIVSIIGLVMQYTLEKTDVAYGVVQMSFSGIEEGKDPLGGTFNPDEIRNSSVVNKALAELGLNKKGDPSGAEIRGAISVEGKIPSYITAQLEQLKNEGKLTPEALESLKFHPTTFIITLDTSKVANLSNADAKRIVDTIMAEYQKWFQTHYQTKSVLITETVDEAYIKSNEFADSIIYMSEQMTGLSDALKSLNARSGRFKDSEGKTFNNYITALNVLKSKYDSTFALIKSNGIARDLSKAQSIISAKSAELTGNLGSIDKQLEDYKDIVKNFEAILKPPAGTDNNNIIISYPDAIAEWIKEISTKQTDLADYKSTLSNKKSDYDRWNTALTSASQLPEDDKTLLNAEKSLVNLSNEFGVILAKIDNAAAEFWNYDVNANVQILSNAMLVTTKGAVPWTIMFVVAIVAGVAIGLIFTPAVSRAIKKHSRNKNNNAEVSGDSQE